MISYELSLNRESVQTTFLHDLGMQNVCVEMVPKIFPKTCKRKLKTIWIFLGRSSQEMKLGFSNTILKQRGKAPGSGRLQNYPDSRRCVTQSNKIVAKATNTMLHKNLKHKNRITYVKEIATQ